MQYYFPLSSDKAVTAWVPLQPTPAEMGPLQFTAGSHKVDIGRHLRISGTNQHIIDQVPITRFPGDPLTSWATTSCSYEVVCLPVSMAMASISWTC